MTIKHRETYLEFQAHSLIMEENVPQEEATSDSPEPTEQNITTLENVGKGLAFLGMIVFLLTTLFYFISRGQPEEFHLFAETTHLILMSSIAWIFVIVGYVLTKIKPKTAE